MTRIYRIPYYYLSSAQMFGIHKICHYYLDIIHDIHKGIPNRNCSVTSVKQYWYHPSFLIWAHNACVREFDCRKFNHKTPIPQSQLDLKSLPLSDWIPPKEDNIAKDIIYLLESWQSGVLNDCKQLPLWYIELAERYFDVADIEQMFEKRIEVSSKFDYNVDARWYFL